MLGPKPCHCTLAPACRRVLCEDLNQAAASKGLAAAAAAGDAERQIERADAESRYAALEEVLPETAEEMAGIIAAHAAGGDSHRFATCQLMLLAGTCMVSACCWLAGVCGAGRGAASLVQFAR